MGEMRTSSAMSKRLTETALKWQGQVDGSTFLAAATEYERRSIVDSLKAGTSRRYDDDERN
jgi:hypothetical protein